MLTTDSKPIFSAGYSPMTCFALPINAPQKSIAPVRWMESPKSAERAAEVRKRLTALAYLQDRYPHCNKKEKLCICLYPSLRLPTFHEASPNKHSSHLNWLPLLQHCRNDQKAFFRFYHRFTYPQNENSKCISSFLIRYSSCVHEPQLSSPPTPICLAIARITVWCTGGSS